MYNNSKTEMVINIREIIWDLLGQWKAIIIVSLIAMLVVCGLKYTKDLNTYNEEKAKAAAEQEAPKTVEEKVSEVINSLPKDERVTVEYLSMQAEWIESQKEYIANSILMNSNPANQRTLMLDYLISTTDTSDSNITALLNGYARSLTNEKTVISIGKVIDPSAESRYIAELIRTNVENTYASNTNETIIVDTDDNGAVLSIYIALPEGVDAQEVTDAVTTALQGHSGDFISSIGQHKIRLLQSGEGHLYNTEAVTERNNILQSIYNQTNNTKNMRASLSDAQKKAVDSIADIRKSAKQGKGMTEEAAGEITMDTVTKPSVSKKYALLGFVLGVFMYSFAYLLLVIIRGRIGSASDAEHYTQSRLLGQVYYKKEYKGFEAFIHSKLVEKLRYKDKMDEVIQLRKALTSLEAECEHKSIKALTFLNFGITKDVIDQILSSFKSSRIEAKVLDITDDSSEKNLLHSTNAVYLAGKESTISDLNKATCLCSEYDIKRLGCIFIGNYCA